MATYVVLASFTDQGIRSVKDTAKRARAGIEAGKNAGVEVKAMYWTLGQYDQVVVVQAPDEKAAVAFGLSVAAAGNIRCQTLRAFDIDEMTDIVGRMK